MSLLLTVDAEYQTQIPHSQRKCCPLLWFPCSVLSPQAHQGNEQFVLFQELQNCSFNTFNQVKPL